jgi:hypothetical protein
MTISQFLRSFRKRKNFPFARFFRPNISIFANSFFVKKFANIFQLFTETSTFLSGRMQLLLSYKCFCGNFRENKYFREIKYVREN